MRLALFSAVFAKRQEFEFVFEPKKQHALTVAKRLPLAWPFLRMPLLHARNYFEKNTCRARRDAQLLRLSVKSQ